jgi:hypothetical protein
LAASTARLHGFAVLEEEQPRLVRRHARDEGLGIVQRDAQPGRDPRAQPSSRCSCRHAGIEWTFAVHILNPPDIRATLVDSEIIDSMRDALIAQSNGECDTPMPMHLAVHDRSAEVHIKSSYRCGGRFFALKIAGTFPRNTAQGRSSSTA